MPKTKLNKSKFGISCRGPSIWNNVSHNTEKEIEPVQLFKSALKLLIMKSHASQVLKCFGREFATW